MAAEPDGDRTPAAALAEAGFWAEVSRKRHGHAGTGALIGLVAGAAAGVGAGLIACADDYCVQSGGDYTGWAVAGLGAGGALVGAGIGALVGSLIRSDEGNGESLRGGPVGIEVTPSGGVMLALRVAIPWAEP